MMRPRGAGGAVCREDAIRMGCGNGGVENSAQQRAFVGHRIIAWHSGGQDMT
jgi:hypothetical protein